jgi:predicted O-methyltransferase YrrM
MNHFYLEPQFTTAEVWFDYESIYRMFVEKCPDHGHIIEVGSWKGRSSVFLAVEIINSNKQIKFDCIDTWLGTINDQYHSVSIKRENNKLFELFLNNIEPVKHIITPIRSTSLKASSLYQDESIDMIFIDADHSYEAATLDIEAWLPKVKKNGILAGHDYINHLYPGVKRAVDNMCKGNIKIDGSSWIYNKI